MRSVDNLDELHGDCILAETELMTLTLQRCMLKNRSSNSLTNKIWFFDQMDTHSVRATQICRELSSCLPHIAQVRCMPKKFRDVHFTLSRKHESCKSLLRVWATTARSSVAAFWSIRGVLGKDFPTFLDKIYLAGILKTLGPLRERGGCTLKVRLWGSVFGALGPFRLRDQGT